MEGGDSWAASFMTSVEDSVIERECKLHAEGLRSTVKLSLYKTFSKKYLRSICME